MNKLKAILNILFSDNYAVFTWKDAPSESEYMASPKYSWICKKFDDEFFDMIRKNINTIIEKHSKGSNIDITYS